jgi:hypothetical protein
LNRADFVHGVLMPVAVMHVDHAYGLALIDYWH